MDVRWRSSNEITPQLRVTIATAAEDAVRLDPNWNDRTLGACNMAVLLYYYLKRQNDYSRRLSKCYHGSYLSM